MRNAAVAGVAMLGFLVWLWFNDGSDSSSTAWLKENDLSELCGHYRFAGLTSREQLLELPLHRLKAELSTATFEKLELALARLELEEWLNHRGLGEFVSVVKREGVTSKAELLSVDMERAVKMSKEVKKPELSQKFLTVLTVNRGVGGEEQGTSLWGYLWWLVKWVLLLAIIGIVGAAIAYAVVMLLGVFILLDLVAYAFVASFTAFATGVSGRRFNLEQFRQDWDRRRAERWKGFTLVVIGGFLSSIVKDFVSFLGRFWQSASQSVTTVSRRVPREVPPDSLGVDLYNRFRGRYLDVRKCRVEWNHKNDEIVGGSTVATVTLFCRNSEPYTLQLSDQLSCFISHTSTGSAIPHVVEPSSITGQDSIKVSFTVRLSGSYCIDIKVNGSKITGSSLSRSYLPGPVDPSKTVFTERSHVIVMTQATYYPMTVVPKDSFGNTAILSQEHLTAEIRKDGPEGTLINPECVVEKLNSSCYEVLLKVDDEGHYIGCIKYQGQRIGPPSFSIICLSDSDTAEVDKNLGKRSGLNVWYEAQMPCPGKAKKVYCYIFPRQLQVREYYLKFIPSRLFTCRVCPTTRIQFHPERGRFTLDDGFQKPVTLISPQREVLGATFYKLMLKNIGGSEKFNDKQKFFFTELKRHHHKESRGEIRVSINRTDLLKSTMQALKWFSVSDWCKKFYVVFHNEEGMDCGGLSRELFELLCVECFDPNRRLFRRFKDDPQALLKYYEFAGRVVGKCLYESAHGNPLLVKARFTRSFLANVIGLRINHKYFESDDPDLYVTKIQYIRDNDVSDLGLVFAEEEFSQGGSNPKVVPLIEHGEDMEVTEENKMQYLNLLAQYRLAKCCKEEIESFVKGLNELIPDHLLSIFDENELELLMCGMGKVQFNDLKKHTVVNGSGQKFHQVVSWFWSVVSSFTEEELARLLQFVTGCSQLPTEGFKALSPPFKITSAPIHGRLPTAHTCFNQLCLPTYDSCEQFQQALMIAINEGAEGFGFL